MTFILYVMLHTDDTGTTGTVLLLCHFCQIQSTTICICVLLDFFSMVHLKKPGMLHLRCLGMYVQSYYYYCFNIYQASRTGYIMFKKYMSKIEKVLST